MCHIMSNRILCISIFKSFHTGIIYNHHSSAITETVLSYVKLPSNNSTIQCICFWLFLRESQSKLYPRKKNICIRHTLAVFCVLSSDILLLPLSFEISALHDISIVVRDNKEIIGSSLLMRWETTCIPSKDLRRIFPEKEMLH